MLKLLGSIFYLPVIVICMIISQIYFERFWIAHQNTTKENISLTIAISVSYFLQEFCIIQLSALNIHEIAFVQVISITMISRKNIYKVWWWLLGLTPLFVYTVEYFSKTISANSWWYWVPNMIIVLAISCFLKYWRGISIRARYFCAIGCLALLGIISLKLNNNLSFANGLADTLGLFFIAIFEDRRYAFETRNNAKLKLLHKESERDDLNGLLNYRAFSQEIDRLTKDENINNIIIGSLDIDHFKHINDTYGHFVGNEVLSYFSTVFKQQIHSAFPQHGKIYRFGGEEFSIIISNHSLEEVYNLLRMIEKRFNSDTIKTKEGLELTISFSCSLTNHRDDETLDTTLRRADKMLYSVKNNGRGWIISDNHLNKRNVGEENHSYE